MMKIYPSKLVLCFLILTTFLTSLQALPDDEKDPPTTPFQIVKAAGESGGDNKLCDRTLEVYVTNLDTYNVPLINGFYTITNQVPQIYAQITINGNTIVVDANSFMFYENFEVPDPANPLATIWIDTYVAKITLPKSLIPLCDQNPEETYNAEMRLLTPTTSSTTLGDGSLPPGYDYYPVASYGAVSDLFSCTMFDFTACICDNSCGSNISNSFNQDVACRKICAEDRPNGDGGNGNGFGLMSQGAGNSMATSKGLEVYPNPFGTSFQLQYLAAVEEQITITMINSSGQKVSTWQEQVYQGDNTLSLDSKDLPTGIYFLQVSSGNQQNQFLKVFKN